MVHGQNRRSRGTKKKVEQTIATIRLSTNSTIGDVEILLQKVEPAVTTVGLEINS